MKVIVLNQFHNEYQDWEKDIIEDYVKEAFNTTENIDMFNGAALDSEECFTEVLNHFDIGAIVYYAPSEDYANTDLQHISRKDFSDFQVFMEVTPKMTPWMKAYALHKMKKSSMGFVERFID